MTKHGISPWIDWYPKSRVPSYPQYRGAAAADVVIVGGGLTGCTSAYSFAAAGTKPLLLEADRLGRGASGAGAGIISDDPGVDFGELERAIGRRSALKAWQAWRRAALDFQALLRRLDVKCGLEPRPLVTIARSGEEAARLKREQSARSAARVEAALVPASRAAAETGIPAPIALRSRDSAVFDPYRATIGLAAAAAARGARIHERTAVEKITFTRKYADVITASGTIRTTRVIIATPRPTRLFRSLERHFWFKRSFSALTAAIPAAVRRRLGDREVLIRDLAAPAHLIRWVDDERLLVTGADADPTRPNLEPKILVQRTGQLMYELSTLFPEISGIPADYGWDAPYARSADKLPYFGAHRNYPFHLFAFGDSSHSATGAYLASRIFLREHAGDPDPTYAVFGFHR
jgi:glycine/D-amino acid oxidase-like deaminating enzyme